MPNGPRGLGRWHATTTRAPSPRGGLRRVPWVGDERLGRGQQLVCVLPGELAAQCGQVVGVEGQGGPRDHGLVRDGPRDAWVLGQRNGNDGIGKPEALKHDFAGYWSRRITDEHRLVYKIAGDQVRIAACRYHYG